MSLKCLSYFRNVPMSRFCLSPYRFLAVCVCVRVFTGMCVCAYLLTHACVSVRACVCV